MTLVPQVLQVTKKCLVPCPPERCNCAVKDISILHEQNKAFDFNEKSLGVPEGSRYFDPHLRCHFQRKNGVWEKTEPPTDDRIIHGESFEDYKQRTDSTWTPYCLKASCGRMEKRDYGFECPKCKNKVGNNMHKILDN